MLIITYGTINIMTTEAVFLANSRPDVIAERETGRGQNGAGRGRGGDGVVGAAADGLTDKVADMQADGVAGDWSQGVRTV